MAILQGIQNKVDASRKRHGVADLGNRRKTSIIRGVASYTDMHGGLVQIARTSFILQTVPLDIESQMVSGSNTSQT